MSHLEVVILRAFRGRRIAAYGIHVVHIAKKSSRAPGEHLVRVALVAHVEYELVFRRVKHVVQGYRRLHEPKVGPHMASMLAHAVQHGLPCLICHCLQRFQVQLFQVGWRLNLLYVHLYILFYFVLDILVMLVSCLVSRLQNYTYYHYIIIPQVQIILPQLLFFDSLCVF